MRYIIDNDLHIHSRLSICSDDEGQTPEAILSYAKENGLKKICVTDHYWDAAVKCNTAVNWWYEKQNFNHISQSCPLPVDDEVSFLFGCEADMDSDGVIGLPKERWDDFGFIIVSTTHFHHMWGDEWEDKSNQAVAQRWVDRLEMVLNADLPFKKVGIAHLACGLIATYEGQDYVEILNLIPEEDMKRLFTKAAKLGVGIEINYSDFDFNSENKEAILRIFRTAKECGCKFYLGSDAHERDAFIGVKEIFERAIDLLDLKESDKFILEY